MLWPEEISLTTRGRFGSRISPPASRSRSAFGRCSGLAVRDCMHGAMARVDVCRVSRQREDGIVS
jgi:hypothetical protein